MELKRKRIISAENSHKLSLALKDSYRDAFAYTRKGFLDYLEDQNIPIKRNKILAHAKDYDYFKGGAFEPHRLEYERQQDQGHENAEKYRQEQAEMAKRVLAEESQRGERQIQDVKSRLLLKESGPTAARISGKVRPRCSVPPDAPKQAAIDFGFLELLLPGYLAENSKEFRQPAEAPVYKPLPGPDWIRLLVIEPWSADENRLRCHLKAVRLDDAAGKHYALSYCWGQAVRGEV